MKHFQDYPKARWNGRQIRNACQTALALAEFEAQGNSHDTEARPTLIVKLNVAHFEKVRNAYLEFTKYINEIYQTDAKGRAKEGKIRAVWLDDEDFSRLSDKRKAFASATKGQPDMGGLRQTPSSNEFSQSVVPQAGWGQQYQHPGQQQFFQGSNLRTLVPGQDMPHHTQDQAFIHSQFATRPTQNQPHIFDQPVPAQAGHSTDQMTYPAVNPASRQVHGDGRAQYSQQPIPTGGSLRFGQAIQAIHERSGAQGAYGQEPSSDFTMPHGTAVAGGHGQ